MRARNCIGALAIGALALGVSVTAAPRDGAAANGKERSRTDLRGLATGSDAVLRGAIDSGAVANDCLVFELVPVQPPGNGIDQCSYSISGNTATLTGNDCNVWFDARLSNWDCACAAGSGCEMKTWQVNVGPDELASPGDGRLPAGISRPIIPCTAAADCNAAGLFSAQCAQSFSFFPPPPDICNPLWIDTSRPDNFSGAGSPIGLAACAAADIRCGATLSDANDPAVPFPAKRCFNPDPAFTNSDKGLCDVDADCVFTAQGSTCVEHQSIYAMSVVLQVDPGFTGTAVIDIQPESLFENNSDIPPGWPIGKFVSATVEVPTGSCCNLDQTCTPDVTRDECHDGPPFFRPGEACPADGGDDCIECQTDAECDNNANDPAGACTTNHCRNFFCEFDPIPGYMPGGPNCCNPAVGPGSLVSRVPADPDPCEVYTCSVDDALSLGVRNVDPAPSGTACDDGSPCTIDDACDDVGLCAGDLIGDLGIACTEDADCPEPGFCDADGFCDCTQEVNLSFNILPGDKDDPNCFNEADKITVEIKAGPSAESIIGGQFHIDYDPSCIAFQSAMPGGAGDCIAASVCANGSNNGGECLSDADCPGGVCLCERDDSNPYTLVVQENVDESTGRILYAVSVAPGAGGTFGNVTMATITFTKLGGCSACSLQFLNENPLNTLLVAQGGQSIQVEKKASKQVRQAPSVSIDGPDTVKVNVACDSNTREVTWGAPTVTSDCEDIELVCTGEHIESGCIAGACCGGPNDGEPCTTKAQCPLGACFPGAMGGGNFPVGNTNYCCNAVNSCGNAAEHCWTVTVNDATTLDVEIQLSPTMKTKPGAGLVRCIKFEVFSNCVQAPLVFEEDIAFGGLFNLIGHFNNAVKIPSQIQPACITARDQLHTLRSCYLFQPGDCDANGVLNAVFKADPFFGGNWLIGGNLDGWKKDNPNASHDVIDILDFGTLVSEWMVDYGSGDTPCGTSGPNADINGDGIVDLLDYSFVAMNFLEDSKDCCCPGSASLGNTNGRTSVTVEELKRTGMKDLTVADLNNDGVVDMQDMALLMQGVRPQRTAPDRDGKSSTGSRSLGR